MAIFVSALTKDGENLEFEVKGKITVGRSSKCDFKIEDSQMSGKHGFFEVNQNGELIYGDLNSTNGSYLNNSTITQTQVRLNDVIRLGTTLFRINGTKLTSKERVVIGKRASKTKADYKVPDHKTKTSIKK